MPWGFAFSATGSAPSCMCSSLAWSCSAREIRATRVAQVVAQRNRVRLLGMVPEWIRGPSLMAEHRLLAQTPAGLAALVRELRADEIVVAVDDRRNRLPIDELLACRMAGVTVLDDASFVERERGLISLTDLSPSWLIFSDGFSAGPLTEFVKRAVDLVMALLLLPLIVAVPAADCAGDPAR